MDPIRQRVEANRDLLRTRGVETTRLGHAFRQAVTELAIALDGLPKEGQEYTFSFHRDNPCITTDHNKEVGLTEDGKLAVKLPNGTMVYGECIRSVGKASDVLCFTRRWPFLKRVPVFNVTATVRLSLHPERVRAVSTRSIASMLA